MCDVTGHFQCQVDCPDASTPTACVEGAACTPNSGCGIDVDAGCARSCSCDSTSHLKCTTICPSVDAGCVQTALCIIGDHWDPARCQCVPDACTSGKGGACGGFTTNPCQCAAGLVCVPNVIPDLPGACEEPQTCCPVGWYMYACTEASGGPGHNCHNPMLQCASSSTCGGGCDFRVAGQCPM